MRYVQYGCGLSAPPDWINYDASPSLRLQKVLGRFSPGAKFPKNVRYGDIVKGLPEKGVDGVYCSHVLEHLSLEDCRRALTNTLQIMRPGAIFRCVVPDLECMIAEYTSSSRPDKAIQFVSDTLMGSVSRPRGMSVLRALLGNERHLWMWDKESLSMELEAAGFVNVRPCRYGDCPDPMFLKVEDESRFKNAVALEGVRG